MSGPSFNASERSEEGDKTLYERMGGDVFINMLVCSFFDEIVENPDLSPFFKNISVSALKTHQVKLFRVIFGKDEEKPEEEDLLDFMLRTHTRLFRELGLNAEHFDMVATCFVQGLETFQVAQPLIDECVAVLVPLRVVFEYGAQVAEREKLMDRQTKKGLPWASPHTIGTDTPVVLPEYSKITIPKWLPRTLKKESNTPNVRAWTCDLTDRFGAEGDEQIADTFMDQPYMDHHVYLVAFLQLAFFPKDTDDEYRQTIQEMVLYPRGRRNDKLSREIYDRMISQFLIACHKLGLNGHATKKAESQLRSCRSIFSKKTVQVGGVNAPHILRATAKKEGSEAGSDGTGPTVLTSLSILHMDNLQNFRLNGPGSTTVASEITGVSMSSGLSDQRAPKSSKKKNKKKSSFDGKKGALGWLRGNFFCKSKSS